MNSFDTIFRVLMEAARHQRCRHVSKIMMWTC